MFRIYGKGDTVSSSEYWDGRTKYNLLQKFIQGQYSSFKDLIDPIKELITQNFETFDFLERFSETEVIKTGVFENSLQNECIISTDDIVSVSLDGAAKVYARIAPGIIAYSNNIQINNPAVDLASKQLEDFLNLDEEKDEKVDIKYSYETDSFKCRIYKKPKDASPVIIYEYANGASWDDDSTIGYTHSAEMIADLYNDSNWKDFFIENIGDDLTKINIEHLVELESDGTFYWVMNQDGFLELTQDTTDKFIINQFTNTSGVASAIDNTHLVYSPAGAAQIDEDGMIYFESTEGIRFTDDSGSEIQIDSNGDVSLTNGTVSVTLSGGDVTVSGNLTVSGTETTVDTASLLVSDNIIEVNKDQTGTPLAGLQSGLRVNRGDLDDYYILFDEDTQSFMIGTMATLQKVATREDSPTDTGIPFWNDTAKQFQTSASILWNGSKILSDIETVDGLHANDNAITDNDTTLTTKNKVKSYVDNADSTIQTNLDDHEEDIGNPHAVTKAQVGLSNTPNWVGSTNASLGGSNSTIPSQAAVKTYVDNEISAIDFAHFTQTDNPHEVTKAQVGLSNVPNWSGSTNTALGTSNTVIPSQNAVKTYVDNEISAIDFAHFTQTNNPHFVTKDQVGLGNVPNWSGITTWGTPTDSQIPSAKLVKDSLDDKSQVGHTHSYLPLTGGTLSGSLTVNTSMLLNIGEGLRFLTGTVSGGQGNDGRIIRIEDVNSPETPDGHLAITYGSNDTPVVIFNGSTSDFTNITEGGSNTLSNDISGDADTVDGQHASAFADVSHTHSWTEVTSKPSTFTPSSHTHPWSEVTGKPITNMNFGSDTFNGFSGKVVNHGLGAVPNFVDIMPSQDADGYMGEVWVENITATSFTAYCSGSTTTSFLWLALI